MRPSQLVFVDNTYIALSMLQVLLQVQMEQAIYPEEYLALIEDKTDI